MERERFESLVARAVETLPEEFRDRMENVDVVVEDRPSERQLLKSRLEKGHTLLGLYEGVPLTGRTSGYGMVVPDKITIFQKTIEAFVQDEDGMVEEIRSVVLHEIAHHFGIGDARLDQIEEERRKSS
jgi:predicted Zn-dependent protease with MMP-like domain